MLQHTCKLRIIQTLLELIGQVIGTRLRKRLTLFSSHQHQLVTDLILRIFRIHKNVHTRVIYTAAIFEKKAGQTGGLFYVGSISPTCCFVYQRYFFGERTGTNVPSLSQRRNVSRETLKWVAASPMVKYCGLAGMWCGPFDGDAVGCHDLL